VEEVFMKEAVAEAFKLFWEDSNRCFGEDFI
jgi:hypothetical protein